MPARYAEAKSVRLTDAGRAFLEETRAIVKHTDEAVKIARTVASAEPKDFLFQLLDSVALICHTTRRRRHVSHD